MVELDMTFVRQPVRVVAKDEKRLRNKTVRLVKVQWSDNVKDCTWEIEDMIRATFPGLF